MFLKGASALLILATATVTLAAAEKVCALHKQAMPKKTVQVLIVVCRHNKAEWQQYTNARVKLFPHAADAIELDAEEIMFMKSKEIQKKYGWKSVPTHTSILVCAACDQAKAKWNAEHPPKKYKPDELPPP